MVSHVLAPSDPAGTQQSLMGMINLDGPGVIRGKATDGYGRVKG